MQKSRNMSTNLCKCGDRFIYAYGQAASALRIGHRQREPGRAFAQHEPAALPGGQFAQPPYRQRRQQRRHDHVQCALEPAPARAHAQSGYGAKHCAHDRIAALPELEQRAYVLAIEREVDRDVYQSRAHRHAQQHAQIHPLERAHAYAVCTRLILCQQVTRKQAQCNAQPILRQAQPAQ